MSNIKKIYTIGYEGSSIEEFINKLKAANVDILIDARLKRGGRKLDFCAKNLQGHLEGNKIAYMHYKELGTPAHLMEIMKNNGHYSMDEYAVFLDSNKSILNQVNSEITLPNIAIMCFEKDAKDCHRSVVADRLSKLTEASVRHL